MAWLRDQKVDHESMHDRIETICYWHDHKSVSQQLYISFQIEVVD